MRVTLSFFVVVLTALVAAPGIDASAGADAGALDAAAQTPAQRSGGTEQTERITRKINIGRDGRFTISNIAGDIVIAAGSGNEVSIDAIKRTVANRRELADVVVDITSGAGRVDVRTTHTDKNVHVRVDFTITVPASTEVEAKSVSGNVRITGVQGSVRAETISGGVTTSGTPKLEMAKSVSGDVDISDISTDRGLMVSSISGALRGRNIKARSLDLNSVSGSVTITDAACERISGRSISGSIEYAGTLARGGRYDLNSHSGTIRMTIPDSPGYRLTASTFSGTIRADQALTPSAEAPPDRGRGRGRGRRGYSGFGGRSVDATVGDGDASVTIHTFSSDIVVSRR